MYEEWFEKYKEVTGTITDVPEEKEYPHIIEKLDITFFDYDAGTKKLKIK